jgi:hypothetical protein
MRNALAADLRCALDPVGFAIDRLGFTPDPWQASLLRSSAKQLLLNCSRQAGKSTATAIVALHTALFRPNSLTLLVSPSLRQSRELFAKVVVFLKRLDTRPNLDEDNRLSFSLDTGSRVVSLPGDEKTIRGYSAPALVIEDEAAYVPDEVNRAVRPMLAVGGGRLILMSTPAGRRGHFFDAWENGGEECERVAIKARECPRIKPEFLEQERRNLGDWWYRQEYECEFIETVDQLFRLDDIRRALTAEVKPLFPQPIGDDNVKPLRL